MRPFFAISVFFVFAVLLSSCKQPSNIPQFDHVIIVMEENHAFDEIIGVADAPYINQLADSGALFTDSHGVMHPSEPNYMALFSGSTHGLIDDSCLLTSTPLTTPNLGAALISKGFTFKGYAQTMPSVGYIGCTYDTSTVTVGTLYGRKHCPWVNWLGTGENTISQSLSLPMTDFPKDFSKLPALAFAIPDMDHDMHNTTGPGDAAAIQRGDQWLKENLAAYAAWAKTHNSLLIVTFDEDDSKTTQNHIPTIFYGANISIGKYANTINHYNVLHTLEGMFHLPVSDTTNADPITDVWKK